MYLIAFSEVRDRPEFWSYSNIAVFLLDSKASQNKKPHYNKPQKEPKSKFPYYYHAVILPSSLTSKIDSLLCILYNVKLDTSWLWSISLDWMEKRRNGTERESNFIAAITNYMVDLITLKKMTDGKIALSYSGHLWRCDYIDSEKLKYLFISVLLHNSLKNHYYKDFIWKRHFSSVSIKHVCHNVFAVMLKKLYFWKVALVGIPLLLTW